MQSIALITLYSNLSPYETNYSDYAQNSKKNYEFHMIPFLYLFDLNSSLIDIETPRREDSNYHSAC